MTPLTHCGPSVTFSARADRSAVSEKFEIVMVPTLWCNPVNANPRCQNPQLPSASDHDIRRLLASERRSMEQGAARDNTTWVRRPEARSEEHMSELQAHVNLV